MRSGEIITLISLTLSTIIAFIPHRNRPFFFTLFSSFILPAIILIHIICESPRWQMIPAYVFAGIIILIIISQSTKKKRQVKIFFPQKKKRPPLLLMFFTGLLLFAVILLPIILPVFSLPPPSGPYAVGTVEYTIHDETRPENLTDNPGDYRKLNVKLWYPALPAGNEKKDPYWDNPALFSSYMAEEYLVPGFFFEYLGLVKTHSLIQAPVSQARDQYPVVLSLHGGTCIDSVRDLRIINEDLASHGYIVIGLTHPYSSSPVVFTGGETASCSETRRKNLNMQFHLTQTLWNSYITQQPDGNNEILENIFDMETLTLSEIDIRTGDIRSVLSWLEKQEKDEISTIISGKFDINKIGIWGYHLGGSVALHAFLRDPGIKACINIDGFHYTGTGDIKIEKPYLLLSSEESRLHTLPFIKNQLGPLSFLITLKGTRKRNFSDYSLFSPLINIFHLNGSIDMKTLVDLSRQYMYTFLSQYNSPEPGTAEMQGESLENLNETYKDFVITTVK